MQEHSKPEDALKLVDGRRRGFLTKLLAGGAVAALPAMSTVALGANEGAGAGKGKGGKGKGGGRGKGGGNRDPQAMAARLIEEHDRDGDGALNATELANALQAMAERRGGGPGGQSDAGPGGAGKGKGGAGKGKGRSGKGKGRPGADTTPGGGVKPKRPNAE